MDGKTFEYHFKLVSSSILQTDQLDLGARTCFTFLHYNPMDEETLRNIDYYREQLNLSRSEFIYREPSLEEYQSPYREGE